MMHKVKISAGWWSEWRAEKEMELPYIPAIGSELTLIGETYGSGEIRGKVLGCILNINTQVTEIDVELESPEYAVALIDDYGWELWFDPNGDTAEDIAATRANWQKMKR